MAAPGRRDPARIILTEGPADDCVFAGWGRRDDVDEFAAHLRRARPDGRQLGSRNSPCEARAPCCISAIPTATGTRCSRTAEASPGAFESEKVASGFVTGARRPRACRLRGGRLSRDVDFAHQVLGLKISDYIDLDGRARHDVRSRVLPRQRAAPLLWPWHRARRCPGPGKRLHHFMIETRSITDVGLRPRPLRALRAIRSSWTSASIPTTKWSRSTAQTPSGVPRRVRLRRRAGRRLHLEGRCASTA